MVETTTLALESVATLVTLSTCCSWVIVRRFSSTPLGPNECVRLPAFNTCRLANECRPSTVSVQLVTTTSAPSQLVLLKLMAVSLVKVIAPAGRPHKSSALTGKALSRDEKGCFIVNRCFAEAHINYLRALLSCGGYPANCAFVSTPARSTRLEMGSTPAPGVASRRPRRVAGPRTELLNGVQQVTGEAASHGARGGRAPPLPHGSGLDQAVPRSTKTSRASV